MISKHLSVEERIQQDRIDQLYIRSKPASLTLLIISTIYIAFLSNKFDWLSLLYWYLTLVTVLA